ncbi:hypothetical protein STEG23_010762 [Scotinomys teguina]
MEKRTFNRSHSHDYLLIRHRSFRHGTMFHFPGKLLRSSGVETQSDPSDRHGSCLLKHVFLAQMSALSAHIRYYARKSSGPDAPTVPLLSTGHLVQMPPQCSPHSPDAPTVPLLSTGHLVQVFPTVPLLSTGHLVQMPPQSHWSLVQMPPQSHCSPQVIWSRCPHSPTALHRSSGPDAPTVPLLSIGHLVQMPPQYDCS